MLRLKILFACFFFGLNLWAQNTDSTTYNDDEPAYPVKPGPEPDSKLGIRIGVLGSTLTGTLNSQKIPAFGIVAGGYFKQKIGKSSWAQVEATVSFNGSKYNASPGDYDAIRLLYFNVPLYYMHQIGNNNRILAGIQSSFLLNQSMYLQGNALPASPSPDIKIYDIMPVLGYQKQLPFFAFQVAAKYGLININNNKVWPQNAKPLNNGGTMHNFAVELSILF